MERKIIPFLGIIILLFTACSKNTGFITDADGNKQYKNANGDLVRNGWAEIGKDKYYFDMNGYLLTNQWIEDEYYVDENGKMKVKDWYIDTENNKKYYLGSDGKYIRDTLITINGKDYYFNEDGTLKIDEIFDSDVEDDDGLKKQMCADENGVIRKTKGITKVKDNSYYIDSDGYIYNGGWKEIDKNWYYFDVTTGKMKENEWFEATYYFDKDGKMLKNAISPEGYEIDKEGKVLDKYKKNLLSKDFKYIYQEYCKYPWAEVGADGSYLSIDTNPYDAESKSGQREYFDDAYSAIKKINELLGFPEYVIKKIGETSSLDGKQSETVGDVELTWKYHPDKGAEIMYIIKNSKGE